MNRRHISTSSLMIPLLLVTLLFQNCTGKIGTPIQQNESSQLAAPNNGSGYDGKIYAHLNTGSLCQDGKPFDSAIQLRDGSSYLVRDNCMDIPLDQQNAVQVQLNATTPWMLTYRGELYVVTLLIQTNAFSSSHDVLTDGTKFEIVNGRLTISGNYLARFDASGNPRFTKSHPWLQTDQKHMTFFANGDTLVTHRYTPATGAAFTWIIRLDQNAKVVWSRAVNNPDFKVADVAVDPADKIFIGGAIVTNGLQGFLLELDGNGALMRARTFDGYIKTLHPAPNGDFYLNGSSNSKNFVARMNAAGNVIWANVFPDFTALKVILGDDGNLLLDANTVSNPAGTVMVQHLRLVKVNAADGAIIDTRQFSDDSPANPDLNAFDEVRAAGDGGYLLTRPGETGTMHVLRLKPDLSLDWSVAQPLSNQFTFWSLLPLASGEFWAQLKVKSVLAPYSTDFLTPISFTGWPSACLTCTSVTHSDTVSIPAPTVSAGPALNALTGITVDPLIFPAFTDFNVYLPLY